MGLRLTIRQLQQGGAVIWAGLVVMAACLFLASAPARALDIDRVEKSVVRIEVGGTFGSGFVVGDSSKGALVVTNYHVIKNASGSVTVRPSGAAGSSTGKVIWKSAQADLALVRVAGLRRPVLTLFTGDAPRGESVSAVGFSKLCDQASGGRRSNVCTTRGVVSLISYDSQRQRRVVQLDAVINAGNSGGPVLDDCGRVIGVASQGFSGRGGDQLFVAIHSQTLKNKMKEAGLTAQSTSRACEVKVDSSDQVARDRATDAGKKADAALASTIEAQAKAEAASAEAEKLKQELAVRSALLRQEREAQAKLNRRILVGVGATVLLTLIALVLAMRRPRQQLVQVVERMSRTVRPSSSRAKIVDVAPVATGAGNAVASSSIAPADLVVTVTMEDGRQLAIRVPAKQLSESWFGVTFGRHPGLVDHAIDHKVFSRRHLRLRWVNDCYEVEDLNSANGTILNNVALVPYKPNRLLMEDVLEVGALRLRISKVKEGIGTGK